VGTLAVNIGSPGAADWVFSYAQGNVRSVGVEDFVVSGGSEILRIKARMVTATSPAVGDSGGPLVNRSGELVGVAETGRSVGQHINHFIDVTEVRAFLAEKKIAINEHSTDPDEPKRPLTIGPGAFKSKDEVKPEPAQPAPGRADEQAAAQLLRRAKLFEEGDDNRPTYIAKLKALIAKYPDTAAGKEAKKKLDALAK
jgi:S1-C subfamily serine protease